MNGLDIVLIVAVAGAAAVGVWKGFMRSAVPAVGWVGGLLLAVRFRHEVAALLPLSSEPLRTTLGFLAVFVGALVLVGVLGRVLQRFLAGAGLSGLDRVGGGALLALVAVTALGAVLVWGAPQVPALQQQVRGATLAPAAMDGVRHLLSGRGVSRWVGEARNLGEPAGAGKSGLGCRDCRLPGRF